MNIRGRDWEIRNVWRDDDVLYGSFEAELSDESWEELIGFLKDRFGPANFIRWSRDRIVGNRVAYSYNHAPSLIKFARRTNLPILIDAFWTGIDEEEPDILIVNYILPILGGYLEAEEVWIERGGKSWRRLEEREG